MFSFFKYFRPTFMYKDLDRRYSKDKVQYDWEQVGRDIKKAIKGDYK